LSSLDQAIGNGYRFDKDERSEPSSCLDAAPSERREGLNTAELIAKQLEFGRDTLRLTVEDFAEAELLVRPVSAQRASST
jgi:hypothetical protein